MKRITFPTVTALSLFSFLAACQMADVAPPYPAAADFLFTAKPIPIPLTQAIVLEQRLSQGTKLSTLATTDTHTLTTVDFYGAPFTHISITAPREIGDPWQFASTLSEADWAGTDDSSPWNITITGASTARSIFSQSEVGLSSFWDMYQTVVAMGGPSKIKNLIAASSTTYLLVDTADNLWDPTTQAIALPRLVTVAKQQYDETMASNANGDAESGWEPFLQSTMAQNVETTTTASGELDIQAYTSAFRPQLRQPDANGYIRGAMPKSPGRSVFATYPSGYDQGTDDFARSGKWNYYHCDGGRVSVVAIGCGPAAFAGLLAFHFEYRGRQILGRR